ncbi:CheR family methyltransferase [Calderihabitans maritimus]|uniref:protein-glutamate O-methyltransferase n=1 Tax=Calderihabitans maritimus TaxID=1246530 RepID=A0A1Z5HU66_9FIRM|nr:protein-glutamate O-methyltransferase CheR [Calderihabitans maritimus]GAW92948.1 protein-glutamate O-methyltransferase [Calderihabitans maritimus]
MEFTDFKQQVYKQFGIDLNGYKERQLKRRITSLMLAQGFKDYRDYFLQLQKDRHQLKLFLDKLTINVSEFFRNPEVFAQLERQILPALLERSKRLRVWSAACSNGAEPYSIAILLDEIDPRGQHTIVATDVDLEILRVARAGEYGPDAVKNVSPQRLHRYFTIREGRYVIKETIRRRVWFRQHDLLVDRYGTNYDLILCRNVAIYFTRETQEKMHRKFFESLKPGGVLCIGASESIIGFKEIGFSKISPSLYKKEEKKGNQDAVD